MLHNRGSPKTAGSRPADSEAWPRDGVILFNLQPGFA